MKTETIPGQSNLDLRPNNPFIEQSNNPADTALVAPTAASQSAPASPNALIHPSNHPVHPSGRPRNGKVARLPKPLRDMVNRMLFNHIPQEKIVGALEELAIKVTQRNISNWKTRGGYREWCLAQEHAIQLHNHQDNLLDLIRRHDAGDLSEVGLQAAATQLSQFFLTPAATQLLASDARAYDLRVSTLARISAQLRATQQYRDDCAKGLGHEHDPARIRKDTDNEVAKLGQSYSSEMREGRDPSTPHRNNLPPHGALLHIIPPEPPSFRDVQIALLERRQGKAEQSAAAPPNLSSNPNPPEET